MGTKKVRKPGIQFEILGRKWKISVCSEQEYSVEDAPDTVACTNIDTRCIKILEQQNVIFTTIIHELVHAYLAELCIRSTDLDNDNLEEIFAELFANRGEEMIKTGKKLLKKLKQE